MMRKLVIWAVFCAVFMGAVTLQPSYRAQGSEGLQASLLFGVNRAHAGDDTCLSDLRKRTPTKLVKVEGVGGGSSGGGGGRSGEAAEETEEQGDGLVTQIIDYIKEVVDDTSEKLFLGITSDAGFKYAVNAAFTLMIAFFGAAFMFGIVPLTYSQALIRGLKMAFIMALIGGGGWAFFSDYVVTFFNEGTDELIDTVIGIAVGSDAVVTVRAGPPQPFRKLEEVAGDALSPEMMISTLTAFTTGPMGPAMGGMMGLGIVAFIQMLVRAVRVYVISLVAKALLFGLAPIFISFLLFDRTKSMFNGWLNQLVNYSLQPILLFTFLSFFVVLLQSTLENILQVDACWQTTQVLSGETSENMYWRFNDENGEPTTSAFTWEGLADCVKDGGSGGACSDFPISILDILTFLILSHLAYRFSDVVVHIATEIASSMLALDKLRSGFGQVIAEAQDRTSARTR